MSKSCQTWDHFLPLVFPKDSKKSKSFWHWNSGNGDKKTFKRSEQMKYLFKNFFRHDNFTPFMSKNFLIWEHFFHYFSPRISKIEQVWTLDFGKWGQQDRYTEWETPIPKKILLSKAKFAPKKLFLHGYFTPIISKSSQIWDIQLREVGAKRRLYGTSKVNRQIHGYTHEQTLRLIERIGKVKHSSS